VCAGDAHPPIAIVGGGGRAVLKGGGQSHIVVYPITQWPSAGSSSDGVDAHCSGNDIVMCTGPSAAAAAAATGFQGQVAHTIQEMLATWSTAVVVATPACSRC
jgi:hypothetical protein